MKKLSPHTSNFEKNWPEVSVASSKNEKFVTILFNVKLDSYNVSPDFTPQSYDNFGLWSFDVFEVFINKGGIGPYLELQVSPGNQWFGLHITRPRVETQNIKNLGETKLSGEIIDGVFRGEFIIDLAIIPGSGDSIYGNLCACLGYAEKRSYFALNINNDESADFHRPELFVNLDNI